MKLWKNILISMVIGLVLLLITNYIPRNETQSYLLGGGITTKYGIPLISRTTYYNGTVIPPYHDNTFSIAPLIINFSIFLMLGFGTIQAFSKFNNK